jgi:Holliday junction resolvase RusA-like endonuclease
MLGKPGRVSGVVGVRVVIIGGKGWRSNRDLDNTLKPILDLLRYLDIIEEDNTGIVRRIEVTFQTPATKKSDASVTVIVESMS